MVVTDLPPYFTKIIGNNSANVHRIPTNLGIEILHDEPFNYTKLQFDWSTHLHFMADFVKCAKRRSKTKIKLFSGMDLGFIKGGGGLICKSCWN